MESLGRFLGFEKRIVEKTDIYRDIRAEYLQSQWAYAIILKKIML